MQTALDESFIIQKFDVKKGINPWIQLIQYPILEVTQYNDSRYAKIMLENYTLSIYNKLWIPITTQNFYNRSQDHITWFKLPENANFIDANFRFDKNVISLKQGNKF